MSTKITPAEPYTFSYPEKVVGVWKEPQVKINAVGKQLPSKSDVCRESVSPEDCAERGNGSYEKLTKLNLGN